MGHGWREAPRPALPWDSGRREGSPQGLLLCLGVGGPACPLTAPLSPTPPPRVPLQSMRLGPCPLNVRTRDLTASQRPGAGPARQRDLDSGPKLPLCDFESPCLGPRIPPRAAGHGAPPSLPVGRRGRLRAHVGARPPPPSPLLGRGWTPVLSAPPNCPFCPQEDLVSAASPGARLRRCGLCGSPRPRWGGLCPRPGTTLSVC